MDRLTLISEAGTGDRGCRTWVRVDPLCRSLGVAVRQALAGPSEAMLSQRASWARLEGPVMGCDLCAREGREASPGLRRTVHPASSLAVWGVPSLSGSRFRPPSHGVGQTGPGHPSGQCQACCGQVQALRPVALTLLSLPPGLDAAPAPLGGTAGPHSPHVRTPFSSVSGSGSGLV